MTTNWQPTEYTAEIGRYRICVSQSPMDGGQLGWHWYVIHRHGSVSIASGFAADIGAACHAAQQKAAQLVAKSSAL